MKKLLISGLLLCYLAFSCGVMVSFHYCMDKLASTEFFTSGDKQCGKCGMHMDDAHGCCRDEVQVVKIDDDQVPTDANKVTGQTGSTWVIAARRAEDFGPPDPRWQPLRDTPGPVWTDDFSNLLGVWKKDD